MRRLTISRLLFGLGLLPGLLVLWIAGAPTSPSGSALIGGWVGTDVNYCCEDETPDDCDNGEGIWAGCNPAPADACFEDTVNINGRWRADDSHPCHDSPASLPCREIHNGVCDEALL